jgi:hypothetical protein
MMRIEKMPHCADHGKSSRLWIYVIPTPLSVYPWVLLIVLASTILIGNHPHAMKCSGQAAAAVCPEYLIEFCCRESFKTLSPTKFEGNV